MYKNICVNCGKIFMSKSYSKKYCSKECKKNSATCRVAKSSQLCFSCVYATGGCSWSDRFIPVEGWDAIPTTIKDGERADIKSFKITSCPRFVKG